jgi:predicted O-methyltransferase YrrM
MYSRFEIGLKYLQYFFTASSGKGHGIHSPFVFTFIQQVLNDKRDFYAYGKVEALRAQLIKDTTLLTIEDFGAGAVSGSAPKKRTVGEIARLAAKPKKLGQLLFRMVNYYQPHYIVELGTSLGLSTCYLSSGNLNAKLYTLEGAGEIAHLAEQHFRQLSLGQVELVKGNFEHTLSGVLQKIPTVDLVFIDGNHRKKATLDYFEQLILKKNDHTILIFDDIHWSKEMEEAWLKIKQHPDVLVTIDLFFLGLVFFRKEFKIKQDFVIRY